MNKGIAAALLALAAGAAQAKAYDGEVMKIDKAQNKITLKHGELKGLDMPPMTMIFRMQDAKQLDALAVGDRVRFDAAKVGGAYTVTAIRKM